MQQVFTPCGSLMDCGVQAVAHRGNDCYTCEERLCLAVDSSPIQLTGHLKRPDSSVVERGPEKAGVG
ncbi:MAG: hypothetical protein P4L10_01665, partial [Acidobacteriaceae bacterium]|nr:hypothetical protein [Acidobacteriaceae bacterium]